MTAEKIEQTNINFPKRLKEKAKAAAKDREESFTDLVRKGTEAYASFDEWFYQRLRATSEATHYPEWAILQKCVVQAMAQHEAYRKVWEADYLDGPLAEYISTKEGPSVGEQFFEAEKEAWVASFESMKAKKFLTLRDMTPEQREWLEKYRRDRDRAYEESIDKSITSKNDLAQKAHIEGHKDIATYVYQLKREQGLQASFDIKSSYNALIVPEGLEAAQAFVKQHREIYNSEGWEAAQKLLDKHKKVYGKPKKG